MSTTKPKTVDLPPKPIWQYTQTQLAFLVGRLARIARKPFGDDHHCVCGHSVSHHMGNGVCRHVNCRCLKPEAGIDVGCDCGTCIAKDAFDQVKELP